MGRCLVCNPSRYVPDPELMVHMRVEHPEAGEPECWPDGEPVIVDETLEPDDFEESQ